MRKITVKQGQNIVDVAIEQFGNIEGLSYIIEDNDIPIDQIEEGNEILIREVRPIDARVKQFFNDKTIVSE